MASSQSAAMIPFAEEQLAPLRSLLAHFPDELGFA